jgi:hypothetical protein
LNHFLRVSGQNPVRGKRREQEEPGRRGFTGGSLEQSRDCLPGTGKEQVTPQRL